jgi:CHAT domain-containing protein
MLKEIFGDRFKTMDEVKNANIIQQLEEVESLRQAKADLEARLTTKPKNNFANDEVALYNEFVRETNIADYGVFKKINGTDVANMKPMDALVAQYYLQHPGSTATEDQVRGHYEKLYPTDENEVDEFDLAVNRDRLTKDGMKAIEDIKALKEKLKVPEFQPEKPTELSPEEKASLQTGWEKIGQAVSTQLAKLKIPIKNGKDPLMDYEIAESEQQEIKEFVAKYAVENRMELSEPNVKMLSTMVYNQMLINKLPDIVHSVFEKARSLTEAQVHALYENPSPTRNQDTPPAPGSSMTDADKLEDEIFNAEMRNLG